METLENSDTTSKSILSQIFTFNEDMKYELMNLTQYIILSFIPSILVIKYINDFSPDIDEKKFTIEILIEVILQILALFYAFYIIKHIVVIIPTVSGKKYPSFDLLVSVIPIVYALGSMDDPLNMKISILMKRFNGLWNGEPSGNGKKTASSVKVSQPISQNQSQQYNSSNSSSILGNTGGGNTTMINDLPSNPSNMTPQRQQYPDYNSMFQNTPTPLIGAQTPGMNMNEGFEIQPANSVLGGSFGSSF